MSWLSSLKSVFSPAQEVKEDEIQAVLQNYVLPNSENALKIELAKSMYKVVSYTDHQYISARKDHLQQIHDELADALENVESKNLIFILFNKNMPHMARRGIAVHLNLKLKIVISYRL
ncbi:Putative ATP-binding protein [Acinetobacter haemolyticus]|nr:Putative ATP-binding protein [Acinetobacter haemolyticus]